MRKLKGLTVHSLDGCRAVGRERLGALLADTLLPVKGHTVAGRKRLPAIEKELKKNLQPSLGSRGVDGKQLIFCQQVKPSSAA